MSDFMTLEEQLAQLGRELGGESQHADAVVQRAASGTAQLTPAMLPRKRPRMLWQMPAVAAASVAVCVGIWWFSRPTSVYARMLAALTEANSVHASGWTREIVRKWPLEKPAADHGEEPADQKHEMHVWYWRAPDGTPCAYERQGPVVVIRRGGDMKEYQEDADLTFIYEGGYSKDRVAEFGQLAAYLTALQRPSLIKEELGRKLEDGRWVRGIRHVQGDLIEDIWIDEIASLPLRMSRERRSSGERLLELAFTINDPVPEAIATYEPPKTKYVRHGGGSGVNDEWRQHVAEMGRRLQAEPIKGRIEILQREDGRTFANQWALLTPDGKYWVRPLDVDQYQRMTLSYFIDRHAASDADRRIGTWRLEKELHDIELPRADLIHEVGVPWQEWVQFVLKEFDLEYVEQVENGTVWIAKHDGRKLKPWQDVKPPVPYVVEGGVEKKGYVKPGIGHWLRPATLKHLFDDFNRMIDRMDFMADKPWIIDETNLPGPPPYDQDKHGTHRRYEEKVVSQFYVATDAPYFVGHESIDIAREWYENEFGITFVEEKRPVTIHVVREKK